MNLLEKAIQIERSFDPVTKTKIKRSTKIALVGLFVGVFPQVFPAILELFAAHPSIVAILTALGGWGYNTASEWYKGQPKNDLIS